MPIQHWRHNCRGTEELKSEQVCTTCGVLGEFDGWYLSMHGFMARYQYVYGIKPLGPHRKMADPLFGGMRTGCERCSGRGLLNVEGGASWRGCPVCEGTGGHWNRPLDEVDAALVRVLEEFPDAEAPKSTINFMSSAVIYDGSNNIMIDAGTRGRPVYGTPGGDAPDHPMSMAEARGKSLCDPYWYRKQQAARVKGLVAMAKVNRALELLEEYNRDSMSGLGDPIVLELLEILR